ncbi:ABC transporter ATP-binding protein [Saccharopolyspora hirsuta]|uniref:ABC transporter ATP-binding protein n=1 Tax=Saccharopolyspora hirsuta TaxID=1837 RepID=A0A5M7C1W5_SACHI|nr:ABC transporter ATP-binding protein [Saccharopolyspora hirsuta]KAA5836426.1 ABC transporter ATP-binding protein [Saccharopolyspora hirsuta]
MRELVGVVKEYGSRPVLRGVDLAVAAGEVVGVLGTNGSGKSTLLRILAGISRPSSGTTSGRPRTGYVPDRFPARQRMSALAYLCHLGRISGLPAAEARRRAGAWLERFALAGGPDTPLRDLSKGNAQKVGLVQALLPEPDLLVLDEPWSGLDAATRAVLTEVVGEAAAAGTAVVFTDHRPDFVQSTATRSHRLVDGRLQLLDAEVSTCRILLRGGEDADWAGRPGVVAARRDGDVELEVAVAERESLLLEAIRRGCAVIAVDSRAGRR